MGVLQVDVRIQALEMQIGRCLAFFQHVNAPEVVVLVVIEIGAVH